MCLATPADSFWDEAKIAVNDVKKLGLQKHPTTVAKWITDGFRSQVTGGLVQLEGCYIGRELFTSREAYQRFLKKLNGFVPDCD